MHYVKMAGAFNSDSMEDFMSAAAESYKRFETNLESICAKYGQEFPETDIVCMKTGQILNDTGTVKRLKPVQFGGAKLAITKRRADKLTATMSQSNFDVSSKAHDSQSIYSNYVSGTLDQSQFADDATKILSFITVEENEPSDAETISSRDSSNESDGDTSDLDSFPDEIDGDLQPARSKFTSLKPQYEKKLKEDAWYSIGSSSEYSNQDSDTSCQKVLGSLNSCSRELRSKNEDGESTEGDPRKEPTLLLAGNVEQNLFAKRHEGDSGFESGPGKHMVPENMEKNSVRLFCLNEDKINRVMNWVKEQANECYPPPESVIGQEISTPYSLERSPPKLRKIVENSDNVIPSLKESQSPWPHLPKQPETMNNTYTVPLTLNQAPQSCSDKENKGETENSTIFAGQEPILQGKTNESSQLVNESDVSYSEAMNESGCLTPRRIVRARKRAFTPVQPVYSSEQLLDYLRSPMPKTVVEVLSPSCPTARHTENIPKKYADYYEEMPKLAAQNIDQNSHEERGLFVKPFISPALCNAQINNLQNVCMNNLNKNVTKDCNTSNNDLTVGLKQERLSEMVTSGLQGSFENLPTSNSRNQENIPTDDGVTLCEGFGRYPKHDHILSEVPRIQSCESPLITRSVGSGSKKQIFDRLKQAGCSSEPKPQHVKDQVRNSVRARRQLGWSEDKHSHKNERKSVQANGRKDRNEESERFSREASNAEGKYMSLEEARVDYMHNFPSSDQFLDEDMDTDCSDAGASQKDPSDELGGTKEIPFQTASGYHTDNPLVRKESRPDLPNRFQPRNIAPSKPKNIPSKFGRVPQVFNRNVPCLSKQDGSTDLSPVGSRKSSKMLPASGLSPSTGLSQLKLSSSGSNQPHRKSSKELFNTSQDNILKQQKPVNLLLDCNPSPRKGDFRSCDLFPSPRKSHKGSTDRQRPFGSNDPISSQRKMKSKSSDVSLTRDKDFGSNDRHRQFGSNHLSPSPRKIKPGDVSQRDYGSSDRYRQFGSSDGTPSPRKIKSKSSDVSLTKQRDFGCSDLVLSPRKRDTPSLILKKKTLQEQSHQKINEFSKVDVCKRESSTGQSLFKKPTNLEIKSSAFQKVKSKSQVNLSQSSPRKPNPRNRIEEYQRPPVPSNDYLRKWSSTQDVVKTSSNDSISKVKMEPRTKSCDKDLFLVPDGPSLKTLKPISSRKKKPKDVLANRFSDNNRINVVHLTAVHSSRWTSTPAKARSVPILNDSMSTIYQGFEEPRDSYDDDDDDDEVRTVSPYSFMSET